jgi:Fe-S cluster assembly protein SufD
MSSEGIVSPTMRATVSPEVPEALRAAAHTLRNAHASPALRDLRDAAWDTFSTMGIPQTGHEDFSFVSAADLKSILTRLPDAASTACVEVTSATTLTTQSVEARGAAGLLNLWSEFLDREGDAPAALAVALAAEPLDVRLGSGDAATLTFAGAGARADYAVLVEVPAHAKASLSVLVTNPDATAFVNAVVYLHLGTGATLDLSVNDVTQGFQTLKVGAEIGKDARLNLLAVTTGSRLARLALDTTLREPGASLDLRGAGAVTGTNRVHRHLKIRHAAPHCTSNQLFKAVVHGSARSSVDGTVIVDRGAQQTDARQLLQHLLLSPDARADAKPRLLIHADDVKCSHGATVGKTDPAQLFYLLSRGLDKPTANALLTQAFLGEALAIAPEAERRTAWKTLSAALPDGGQL